MNLKEAQEIIERCHTYPIDCDLPEHCGCRGYIEGHSDGKKEAIEQMKPVVEALEKIAFAVTDVIENKQTLILKMVAGKALQTYRRDVLGEKK